MGHPPPPLSVAPEAKKLVYPMTLPMSLVDGPKMEAQLKIGPAAPGSPLSPSTLKVERKQKPNFLEKSNKTLRVKTSSVKGHSEHLISCRWK